MSKEEIARRIRERLEEGGETLYTVDENFVLIISKECKCIKNGMFDAIKGFEPYICGLSLGNENDDYNMTIKADNGVFDRFVNMEFADLTNVFIDNIDIDAVFGSTRLDLEALHELKGDRNEIEADESRQRRARRNRTREEEEEYEI